MALSNTEYMYASAKVKAREGALSYSDRITSYLECKSIDALYDLMLPGVVPEGKTKKEAIEERLDGMLESAVLLVRENAPKPEYFDFLQYEYDCCNLKTLIKCMLRDISSDSMLYGIGTVPAEELKKALSERKLDYVLPKNMQTAAAEAIEAYSKTKDARIIDFILDRACFKDMLENSRLSGCKMCEMLVKTRIDSINIVTLERIARSQIADKESTLSEAFLEGGEIPLDTLSKRLRDENATLLSVLFETDYRDTVRNLGENYSFTELERALDERYLSIVKAEKYVPFGPEVLCSYLVNTVFEVKNARIILAGLSSGLDKEKIRERVRF